MEKLESKPDPESGVPDRSAPRTAATTFSRTLHAFRSWVAKEPFFLPPPEPHRVVFWCCPWGVNLARMVWEYCSILKWPDPSQAHDTRDHGISWTELACSFICYGPTGFCQYAFALTINKRLSHIPILGYSFYPLKHDPSVSWPITFDGLLNTFRHSLKPN